MNNIVLCGFMGCGKTSVGQELAKQLSYTFIDTDEIIEKNQKITIKEIFEKYGENYFRDLEYNVCKEIANMENCVISTGGGLMTYERNVRETKKCSKVIFLDSSFSVISKRLGEDDTRPLFKDKEKAQKLYDERKEKYLLAADYMINGDMTIKETVLAIIDVLMK